MTYTAVFRLSGPSLEVYAPEKFLCGRGREVLEMNFGRIELFNIGDIIYEVGPNDLVFIDKSHAMYAFMGGLGDIPTEHLSVICEYNNNKMSYSGYGSWSYEQAKHGMVYVFASCYPNSTFYSLNMAINDCERVVRDAVNMLKIERR